MTRNQVKLAAILDCLSNEWQSIDELTGLVYSRNKGMFKNPPQSHIIAKIIKEALEKGNDSIERIKCSTSMNIRKRTFYRKKPELDFQAYLEERARDLSSSL